MSGTGEKHIMSAATSALSTSGVQVEGVSLSWQKLSPAEFQQLQDFMACKY